MWRLIALITMLLCCPTQAQYLGNIGTEWEPLAVGDFNGDGKADFAMRRKSDGLIAVYYMDGSTVLSVELRGTIEPQWRLFGSGDFDGNKKDDFLWYRPDDGALVLQLMMGLKVPVPPPEPQPAADWVAENWTNLFGSGIPPSFRMDGAGLKVPNSNGIHYIVHPGVPLTPYSVIRLRLEVRGDDAIVPSTANDPPAKVRLFFGSADTTFAHLRFWSDEWIKIGHGTDAAHPDPNGIGTFEMTVKLDPAIWHTVDGSKDATAFNSMKNGPPLIGFTFSGQFSDGHGVHSTGNTFLVLHAFQFLP